MKYLVIVVDGLTDQPLAERENMTPLQLAETPNLDRLAEMGRTGSVHTIPEDLHAEADVSHLALLGYDPKTRSAGPAEWMARSLGVSTANGEIALCCDFITLQASHNDMVMKDFTAGYLGGEDAAALLEALNTQVADVKMKLVAGSGHHNLMIVENPPLTERLNPPHELIGEGIREFMPQGDACKDLVFIMNQAQIILHSHKLNQTRKRNGEDMVNSIWLWGNGPAPELPPFSSRYDKTAALITASLELRGMALCAGINVADVAGATGFANTDFKAKADEALKQLESHDVVYLHVAGLADLSLHGLMEEKVLGLEDFDSQTLGPILTALDARNDVKLLLTGSHVSSVVLMKHSKDAVPFVVYPATRGADELDRFDEQIVASGSERYASGPELMNAFFGEVL